MSLHGLTAPPAADRSRDMRSLRKPLIALAAIAAVLLLLLIAVPYLFRDRISARLQAQVSENIDARVAWGGVSLSLLRDFPNVTLRLNDLSVSGVERFEGDTLVAVRNLRLVLDLGSVIRNLRAGDPIVVRQLELDRPVARLLVLEDGTANWDILREQPETADDTSAGMSLSLREFTIHDGRLSFDNRQSGVSASMRGLHHSLEGDLTQDLVRLATETRADTVSLAFAGVPYLNDVELELEADIDADMREKRFSFTDDRLRINNLVLAFAGSVTAGDVNTLLDVSFSTPSTDFGDILSLVPAIYANDFASLQTSGTMSVEGSARGEYGPAAFPAFTLLAKVENGTFRYPDLPLPGSDIFLDLAIVNPGGDVDSTVVRMDRFHMLLGNRPVDATLTMRAPVSDPEVNLALTADVDLADVSRTVKLEGVQELAGAVAADFAMHTRRSWVEARQYDRISARGSIGISGLTLQSDALPHDMAVDSALLRLTPRHAELSSFSGRIGSSDMRATGELDNLLGYALHDEELRGRATVSSRHFNLNEWQSEDEDTEVIPVPPKVDFTLQVAADSITYGTLGLTNARGALHVKDQRVTLDGFRLNAMGGTMVATGFYETTNVSQPTFDMSVDIESLDIPTAFAELTTVKALAPIARYATGSFSASVDMSGAIGEGMSPVLSALTGEGTFQTGSLSIQGFPVFERMADVLSLDQIRNPTFQAVHSSFAIEDGRLHLRPFDVNIGPLAMTVAGSNGLDQSLDYDLALAVPTSMLGSTASATISRLASQAGRAGFDVAAAEVVSLNVNVTGTVTDPSVKPDFAGTAGSLREGVQQAVETEIESRIADVEERVDSAADAARERARAEADRLVAEAEAQGARIREEADSLAAKVRREGDEQADALLERASNPAARIAARAAADRLRREADEQAARIVREADERATSLEAQARQRADALVPPGGSGQ